MTRFGSDQRDRSRSTRLRRLKLYPFCAMCEAAGIQRLTAIIDHKTPLAFGGEDTDENCQGLCLVHEAIKTAAEDSSHRAASNHPDWLDRAKCQLWIIIGPPCGGKSTYVADMARDQDLIIDLDEIATTLSPDWERRWNAPLLDRSIRVRNAMLGRLAVLPKSALAWFIVSAPSKDERAWWRDKLGGQVIPCVPPMAETLARAKRRDGRIDHVRRWYDDAARPWRPPSQRRLPKVAFDADGYPLA